MYNDSLYRVSFKCLILNEDEKVLVVKERGRTSWDIPGGGIEHGETIEMSIKRELFEEVDFKDNFSYKIITVHDPVRLLTRDVWQIKIVVLLKPDTMNFRVGAESDEIMFVDPRQFEYSKHESERRIVDYAVLIHNHH